MSRRFDLAERPIQLQEHFLRDLFSAIPIVQEVPGNAEDHVLVLADQSPERFVIAGRRVLQRGIESTEQEWSRRAHLRLYTRKSGDRMQTQICATNIPFPPRTSLHKPFAPSSVCRIR